jgi:putative FmdB family regulatory protein
MPIYTYKCKKCKKEATLRVGLSDFPPVNCKDLDKESTCDGELDKVLRPSSFSLKGGGWFKDGY